MMTLQEMADRRNLIRDNNRLRSIISLLLKGLDETWMDTPDGDAVMKWAEEAVEESKVVADDE